MINPKINYFFLLLLFTVTSCSSEKINLSPVGETFSDIDSAPYSVVERKNLIFYSSEITGLISTFPKFKNAAVNKEVIVLKYSLKDYVGSIESYNNNNLKKAERRFQKSYKKLQKLKGLLSKDEDVLLNRSLVRIKINMTQLQSNLPKYSQ